MGMGDGFFTNIIVATAKTACTAGHRTKRDERETIRHGNRRRRSNAVAIYQ